MPRQWRAKTLTFNLNISKQNASRAQMQIQDTSESGAVRERDRERESSCSGEHLELSWPRRGSCSSRLSWDCRKNWSSFLHKKPTADNCGAPIKSKLS